MRPFDYFFLIGIFSFAACAFSDLNPDEDQEKPVDVVWTGQVKNSCQDIPLTDQEVFLIETKLEGSLTGAKLVLGDTVQTTRTGAEGFFSFQYTDPNERCWYSIHASHPDFLDKFEETRIHPTVANHQQDLILKPKAWLKIRVLDIPEQNVSQNGIIFTNLNVDNNFWQFSTYILPIRPLTGDTTFYAFKPGGELTAFAYYDSDSMKTVSYQAVFPPFDTTELTFTY